MFEKTKAEIEKTKEMFGANLSDTVFKTVTEEIEEAEKENLSFFMQGTYIGEQNSYLIKKNKDLEDKLKTMKQENEALKKEYETFKNAIG
jgi:hypothetical protein